jgi:hypothetical protein
MLVFKKDIWEKIKVFTTRPIFARIFILGLMEQANIWDKQVKQESQNELPKG